jgi:hypothetical protein
MRFTAVAAATSVSTLLSAAGDGGATGGVDWGCTSTKSTNWGGGGGEGGEGQRIHPDDRELQGGRNTVRSEEIGIGGKRVLICPPAKRYTCLQK